MDELIYLQPDEIGVHPVIKYLEEGGVFPYTDYELQRIVASFKEIGPLQPILITPASQENGDGIKWWRIAGKLRIAAAKKIGCNLPCYIRSFASDEEVVQAARYENFIRRHWDPDRILSEGENIAKLMSKRSSYYRCKNVKQIHPDFQALLKSGAFKHYEDSFITALKDLDYEFQESLAQAFDSVVKIKFSRGEGDYESEAKQAVAEKLKKEYQQEIINYTDKIKQLVQMVERLKAELDSVRKEKEAISETTTDVSDVVDRYEQRVATLRAEKHQKEAEIQQLKSEVYNAHKKYSEESDIVRGERFRHISNDLNVLADSTVARMEQITRALSIIFNSDSVPLSKDAVLVLHDQMDKFLERFNRQMNKTKSDIVALLKRYETKNKPAEDQTIITNN